jgi:hypothetical protein
MSYTHDRDFPKKLFVTVGEAGENGYPLTHETVNDIEGDGETVAQYELVRVGTLSVSKRLGKLQPQDED